MYICFRLLNVDDWAYHQTYDVISCLNLLDRCDTPITLLEQIKNSLKPDGILIVALVLPFSQYVESGKYKTKHTKKKNEMILFCIFKKAALITNRRKFYRSKVLLLKNRWLALSAMFSNQRDSSYSLGQEFHIYAKAT